MVSGGDNAESVGHEPPASAQELLITYRIPSSQVYKFASYKKSKQHLTERADAFLTGENTAQYLAISNVPPDNIPTIERGRKRLDLPAMRILYDHDAEMLIIKLRRGLEHELAASLFVDMVRDKIASTGTPCNSIFDVGAARFGVEEGSQKEGDRSLRPTTRTLLADWPSLVVEVGVSESFAGLRGDAHFWLTRSGGQTRIVIVIAVNKTTRSITIERWEDTPRTRTTRASSPLYNPTKMQTVTIRGNGQSIGAPLIIPAAKLFDTVPPDVGPNDFQLDAQLLTFYFDMYWSQLN
jgi:hypothetical protein